MASISRLVCSLRNSCSISLHIKNYLGPFLLGRRKYKYIIATILHEQDQQIKWTRTNQTPDSPIEFPVTKFSNHKIKDSVNCVSNKRGTEALAKYTDRLGKKGCPVCWKRKDALNVRWLAAKTLGGFAAYYFRHIYIHHLSHNPPHPRRFMCYPSHSVGIFCGLSI